MPKTRLLVIFLVLSAAAALVSAPGPEFTKNQKAYYLDASAANFVRPGLVITVKSATIGADGTIRARVTLTDPKGQPLDRLGITTPGTVSVSLIAAMIPNGATQYTAYTTRSQTSPITNKTAIQASGESTGTFKQIADGDYEYTFVAKAPSGFDKTATHTIGAYGSRSLAEFDLGTQYSDSVYNFVPDGTAVKVVRDVIRNEKCNACHDQMAFHGGSRRSIEVCVLCHQPQTVDPDTGNTVDMPVMTHKIHMGADLPSVVAGKPYVIIGNRQSVNDYSDIVFPADTRRCSVCHDSKATQAENVLKANRAACGACHDNVNFDTGENHVDLPQFSDNQCTECHKRQGELEFDASIIGAHTVPTQALSLPGVVLEILAVEDGSAGKSPTVTFSVKDKKGNPIHPSKMQRLNVVLAGPATDYKTYISEAALKADGTSDGRYFWTMAAKVPADAKGTWAIYIEGRRELKLLEGTKKEQTVRDAGVNKVYYFSVDGSKVAPRRAVVSTDKCNACHSFLSLHGGNRNRVEACVVCHNPTMSAGTGAVAVPIDFKVMVHKIHTGAELQNGYKIGNGDFGEVGYPGDRRNCSACHVNGSEQLPLADTTMTVKNPNGFIDPIGPTGAACTGCHDSKVAASHVLANTNSLGESCAACHGPDADFAVSRLHAR